MVSLDQFKSAFAGKVSPDPLRERDKVVSGALKQLKGLIDDADGANGAHDGFKAALKKLVSRYDAARKQSGMDSVAELDKILVQTGHVRDTWLKLPTSGDENGPLAAPPLPEGGNTPIAESPVPDGAKDALDQPKSAPPDKTGGGGAHTSKTLKQWDKGPAVTFLQEQLNDHGADLDPDGDFGPLTQKAVARFQQRAGVNEKGVVGPLTWQALNSAGADGIDIDAAVTLAQKLHSQFDPSTDPVQRGQLARKLLAIATSLERRLGRAVKDPNGRPKLAGKTQWDAAATGVIADLAPFAARDQWIAASIVAPPAKPKAPSQSAPRSKSLKEELEGWEFRDGQAPIIIEVQDAKTGRPIPGAKVSFDKTEYTVDDDGRVRTNLESPNSWVLKASSPGYRTSEETFESKDKEPVLVKLRLTPKENLSGVPMEFTVVNELDGSKVKQAKVTVGKLSQATDADGFASLVLPPGNPQVTVTAKGYYQYEERVTVPELDLYSKNPGVKKVFKIKPQTPLADELQDWKVEDGKAPLIVEVLDSKSGKPVFNALVQVDTGESARVKGDGRFRINVAAPGTRKVEVSLPGYQTAQDSFQVEPKRGVFRTVRLFAKDPATLVPTAMEITIVDETDTAKKVVGATFTVGKVSQVSGQGGIVTMVLPPGVHKYTITKKGYHTKEMGLRVPEFDATGSGAAVPVEITLRPQTALADEMRNMGRKEGKSPIVVEVLDAKTGKPIPGASIRFEDGEVFATDKNGRDRYHLRFGKTWKIEVTASGYQKGQDSFETKETSGQMRTVKLVPLDAAQVGKVVLNIGVRDGTSSKAAKVANAKVTIGRESGVTNENGLFQVRLLPGVYSYSINADGYAKASGRFDVVESKDIQQQVIDLIPNGAGDVFVRVRRSGSKEPIPQATVWLSQQIQNADGKGEAKFLGLAFGKHQLIADAPGYKQKDSLVLFNSQVLSVDDKEVKKGAFVVIDLEPK